MLIKQIHLSQDNMDNNVRNAMFPFPPKKKRCRKCNFLLISLINFFWRWRLYIYSKWGKRSWSQGFNLWTRSWNQVSYSNSNIIYIALFSNYKILLLVANNDILLVLSIYQIIISSALINYTFWECTFY